MMKRIFAALAALAFLPSISAAQTSPGWYQGFVPTPGQWNAMWASKQDTLGYSPLNRAGDTMLGPLKLTPPTASASGFNVGVGVAPTNPNNGDLWLTTAGIYYRNNGTTLGPLLTSGTLAGSALSAVNDTNVTAALSGSPTVAVLAPTTVTLGWTGQLSVARGGTGSSTAQAARQALSAWGDVGHGYGDANQTLAASDRFAYTNVAITAARTWTLPAANATGQPFAIYIADLGGGVNGTRTLTIQRAGSDTVNGGTNVALSAANTGAICYSSGGTAWSCQITGSGSGTVTSVALSLPAMFSVSGSPVTSAGTLTATLQTQSANQVFAGPSSGIAAAPAFRALVDADVPGSPVTVTSGTSVNLASANEVIFSCAAACSISTWSNAKAGKVYTFCFTNSNNTITRAFAYTIAGTDYNPSVTGGQTCSLWVADDSTHLRQVTLGQNST